MKNSIPLLSLLALSACTGIEEYQAPASPYTLEASIAINDAWECAAPETASTRAETPDLKYLIYLFGTDNKAIGAPGGSMTDANKSRSFDGKITATGTYTLYGLANVLSGEYISHSSNTSITPSSTMALSTAAAPNDVCLGKETLAVTATQQAYTKSVTVKHIMSKLALAVNNVPADITSMSITLPSQANTFDFNGTFTYAKNEENADVPVSQTLTLSKAAAANQDGTYKWSCEPAIVFPCATGTTSMPIYIIWSSASVGSKTVSTTSTYCCLSGKNLSLSTTWSEAYRTSATITTADWSAVEEGTFPW